MTAAEWLAAKARSYHQDARRMERLEGDVAGLTGVEWGIVYRAVSAELSECARKCPHE